MTCLVAPGAKSLMSVHAVQEVEIVSLSAISSASVGMTLSHILSVHSAIVRACL
jgi:hypothetical protein